MTLTFNPDKYKKFLSYYRSKVIRTEEENEEALAIVEDLMHRSNRSPEENELYDLLITLIEKFEQAYYIQETSSNPHSMLLFLLDQQDIQPIDLIDVIGSQEIVTEIIDGRREINPSQAKALGKFFHVQPDLFL